MLNLTSIRISLIVLLFNLLPIPLYAGNAVLSWDPPTTNVDGTPLTDLAGYIVYYGTTPGNYNTMVDVGLTSTPSTPAYTVGNMIEGNAYYFAVTAYDASGNESGFSNEVFKTITDTATPILSAIQAGNITTNSSTISWATNEPATSQIEYGTTSAYGSVTVLSSTLLTGHSQTITGLQPLTTYHYRVRSADAAGNLAISGDNTFTTNDIPDTTPPADIINFAAIGGDGLITLSWTNPPDSDFVGVRIRFRTDNFPNDINDGISLGDFTGKPSETMSTIHRGLQNGVTYYYAASSYDNSGNFQSTVHASATPSQDSSNNREPQDSPSGGGCGIILPKDGTPPSPGSTAEMIAILAMILLVWINKITKTAKPMKSGIRFPFIISHRSGSQTHTTLQ